MPLDMEVGRSPGEFVLDGDPARPLNFRLMFIIVIVISLYNRYWFVQVQVFYAFIFLRKKFNRIQSVQYKY